MTVDCAPDTFRWSDFPWSTRNHAPRRSVPASRAGIGHPGWVTIGLGSGHLAFQHIHTNAMSRLPYRDFDEAGRPLCRYHERPRKGQPREQVQPPTNLRSETVERPPWQGVRTYSWQGELKGRDRPTGC